MDDINIDAIRSLTRASIKGPVIEPHVAALNMAITAAAMRGETSVDPYRVAEEHQLGTTPKHWDAIRQYYEEKGFRWVDHPEPDPGHPRSRPYTTLSW